MRSLLLLSLIVALSGCVPDLVNIEIPTTTLAENRLAYGEALGTYVYCAQQIKVIATDGSTQSLPQPEKDQLVRDYWQRGAQAWNTYLPAFEGVGSSLSPATRFSTELASATASYWTKTGRPGEALSPLRQGIKAAQDTNAFPQSDMLMIQLAQLSSRIGMHENARALLEEIKTSGGMTFVSLDGDPAVQSSVDAHFAGLFITLASGNKSDLDTDTLHKEYAFFNRYKEESRKSSAVAIYSPTLIQRATTKSALINSDWQQSFRGVNLSEENYVRFFRAFVDRKMRPEAQDAWNRLNNLLANMKNDQLSRNTLSPSVLMPQLEAEYRLSVGETQQALRLLEEAEAAAARNADSYLTLDRYILAAYAEQGLDLRALSARIREAAGQYETAYHKYGEIIAWSEGERASLPIDQRQFFFRSQAKEAYLGRIRCAARRWASDGKSEAALDAVLAAGEAMRARQLLETVRGEQAFTATTTAEQLRQRLPEGGGLLQVIETAESAIVIWLDRETARVTLAPLSSDWRQQIAALHDAAAQGRRLDPAIATAVAKVAFAGCADRVAAANQLFVVLDGALATIPLGMLPSKGDYLAERCAVATLPSLSLWTGNQLVATAVKERSALLVADPLFSPKRSLDRFLGGSEIMRSARGAAELAAFTPLPETREEARRVAILFPGAKTSLLFGRDAAESQLKGRELQSFSLVHFATHGILGGEIPLLSEPALVLSYEETEDGFLTASEVARLRLDADLVVLSACNTGSGVYIDGEGVNGLGRAFIVAGSKQVLVSLWPVDSAATVELMTNFYRHMNRGSAAPQALRLAQAEMRHSSSVGGTGQGRGITLKGSTQLDHSHPFYWAPFVLLTTR